MPNWAFKKGVGCDLEGKVINYGLVLTRNFVRKHLSCPTKVASEDLPWPPGLLKLRGNMMFGLTRQGDMTGREGMTRRNEN